MNETAFAGPWSSLPTTLTPWILDVIASMGHTQMTPVQASTIPLFMKHKDVVVEAVTGSGKTLAFVIPVIERLIRREHRLRRHEIGALVITPTRELAAQIHSIFSTFLFSQPEASESTMLYPLPLLLVSSKESSPDQDVKRFESEGSDIIIGTPGRIEEFLLGKGRNSVNVKEMEVLVLDEADRLLDLGFHTTLTRILSQLPKQRRTGLFSATMTDGLSELVRVGLRNPSRVTVKVQTKRTNNRTGKSDVLDERRIPASLQNFYLDCTSSTKLVQLTRILSHEVSDNMSSHFIVYFSSSSCVDYFYKILPSILPEHCTIHSLHGKLLPAARTRALTAFSSAVATGSSSILLTTDVAARGLDMPIVDVVIQFDPPTDPKAFSHRCGRTARAGKEGTAWILLSGREMEYIDFMDVRQIPMKSGPRLPSCSDDDTNEFMAKIRSKILEDRALHDLAVKAYVSFIRAYSKHEASYIFRIKDLDLIGVAKSFGLLRLPKMPELKGADLSSWEDAVMDWTKYAYSDPAQEEKRLSNQSYKATENDSTANLVARHTSKKTTNLPWSREASKKVEREKRRTKNHRKKMWLKEQAGTSQSSQEEAKRSRAFDSEEWDDLAREERMAKKVRRGKLSSVDFDAEFVGID